MYLTAHCRLQIDARKSGPALSHGGVCEILFRPPKKVSLEEETSLVNGTAASLVEEAVGKRQPPNDALKQVVG